MKLYQQTVQKFLFIYKFFIFHTESLVCVYIFKKTRFSKNTSEMIGSESVIVTHHTSATSILILRLTHAKCDFDTNEYDLFTQGVISKHIMRFSHDFYTFPKINTSVILSCTSMIYTRKVWSWHARVWFVHAECDFETYTEIFTRKVWFWHARVRFWHARVWFIHAESDFDTHVYTCRMWFLHAKCDFDLHHENEFDTHKYNS
jgi:hypothetical protein